MYKGELFHKNVATCRVAVLIFCISSDSALYFIKLNENTFKIIIVTEQTRFSN